MSPNELGSDGLSDESAGLSRSRLLWIYLVVVVAALLVVFLGQSLVLYVATGTAVVLASGVVVWVVTLDRSMPRWRWRPGHHRADNDSKSRSKVRSSRSIATRWRVLGAAGIVAVALLNTGIPLLAVATVSLVVAAGAAALESRR